MARDLRAERNRGLGFRVHKALDKEGSYCNDGGFCLRSPFLAALSRPDHICVFAPHLPIQKVLKHVTANFGEGGIHLG